MKQLKYQLGTLLLVLTLIFPQVFQPLQILAQSHSNDGEYLIEEAVEFGSDPNDSKTEEETEAEFREEITLEETTTEETIPEEETTEQEEDGFIPTWLNQLMEEKSQNNTMLEVAYQDYQQIEVKFDFLDITALGEGSTYDFVLDNFTYTQANVEVMEENSDIGLSVVSFLYTAEEGEVNPERDIEDWAMIEFYFVTDILVYSSLSTMSLGFNGENAVTLGTVNEWVDQTASVDVLVEEDQFELNAFGQVLADGEFIYSLGMPVVEAVDYAGGLVAVKDQEVFAANTVTLDDIEAVSFSAVMYVLLIQIVPNNVFMPADDALPAENDEAAETEDAQTNEINAEETLEAAD